MNTPIIKRAQREEQRRMQAADLFEADLSNAEIARRLHVSRMSVSHWYQTWKEQGKDGLKAGHPGQQSRLSPEQRHQVVEALLQGPHAHGFETELWTLARITQVIQKVTGVSYHPGHVWYLLQKLDWSCQKPQPSPKERDEAEIERWRAHDWPRIKRGHKSEGPS
ncbi:MAG TPA: winged helix-turn-helix domain-containing protein [Chthonomonadaceae bacterium]|nr:winged helix-turn-helix domain-containing protein [Chthonomonadaceae bacterium]